jgi:hypothetical protein
MPENFQPRIGDVYDVRITEAHDYDLVGEIVGKTKKASTAVSA